MVSKSFDINSSQLQPFDPGTRSLLLEVSPATVSVILWNKEKNQPEALEVFSGNFINDSEWEQLQPQSSLLSYRNLETEIVHAFEYMVPMPAQLYSPETATEQIQLFFGQRAGMHLGADILNSQSMILAWQLPAGLYQCFADQFSVFRVKHVGTCLLQNAPNINGLLGRIVVYGSRCWVSLWKNGQLQIIKQIQTTQPDDLSWQLLNICKQFDLAPSSVNWELSGMAEESSPMWHAVTRYFEPVLPMEAGVELPAELPGHYFAHLYPSML